jgi:hypothetical protein
MDNAAKVNNSPSSTASRSPTFTFTPSNIPTKTFTPSFTFTPSNTPTNTSKPTSTFTPSNTPTFTPSRTFTPTNTPTFTHTYTFTPSHTSTFKPTQTFTPSNTPTQTPTSSPVNTSTATFTPGSITYNVPLVTGWNLVSFPVHPSSTSTAEVLASVGGSYDLVFAWDGSTQTWLKYDPHAPYGASLNTIEKTMGFWVRMTADTTLTITGSVSAASNISLYAPWSMVGFPASANLALPDAFSLHGLGNESFLVYAYHANDSDPWKKFDSTAPVYSNDLREMVPGFGYWVRTTMEHAWQVNY